MSQPVSMTSSAAASYAQAADEQPTFLNRCCEMLEPERVIDLQNSSYKWDTIGTICIVAYIALAVGAFIAVGLLAEAFLPIAGIAAIALPVVFGEKITVFFDWAKTYINETFELVEMQKIHEEILNLPQQNRNELFTLRPVNDSLVPLLVFLTHRKRKAAKLMEESNKLYQQALTVEDKRVELLQVGFVLENEALKAKIEAVFAFCVLANHPDFRGSLETLGTFFKATQNERLFLQVNNPERNVFFSFNQRDIDPITCNEIKDQDLSNIRHKMIRAMGIRSQ